MKDLYDPIAGLPKVKPKECIGAWQRRYVASWLSVSYFLFQFYFIIRCETLYLNIQMKLTFTSLSFPFNPMTCSSPVWGTK